LPLEKNMRLFFCKSIVSHFRRKKKNVGSRGGQCSSGNSSILVLGDWRYKEGEKRKGRRNINSPSRMNIFQSKEKKEGKWENGIGAL